MDVILCIYVALYSAIQLIFMISIYFILGLFIDISDTTQIIIIWFSGLFSATILFYILLLSDINFTISF
jgi:hypothetical protein|nr:MAG TPA: hypothetical protein [Bacteriophage sp.]